MLPCSSEQSVDLVHGCHQLVHLTCLPWLLCGQDAVQLMWSGLKTLVSWPAHAGLHEAEQDATRASPLLVLKEDMHGLHAAYSDGPAVHDTGQKVTVHAPCSPKAVLGFETPRKHRHARA